MARKDLIAGYEKACEAAGAHAGRGGSGQLQPDEHRPGGDARTPGDWLLVHIGADYATLAVVRGPDLVFFRNRGAAAASGVRGPRSSDVDVPRGQTRRRRVRARRADGRLALRGPDQPTGSGGASKSASRRRSNRSTSAGRFPFGIASARVPSCWMRWRRRWAFCCARIV